MSVPAPGPESFTEFFGRCAHFFHWDDSDAVYRCINCDATRDNPPGSETRNASERPEGSTNR
jgi:hypothetical protein